MVAMAELPASCLADTRFLRVFRPGANLRPRGTARQRRPQSWRAGWVRWPRQAHGALTGAAWSAWWHVPMV